VSSLAAMMSLPLAAAQAAMAPIRKPTGKGPKPPVEPVQPDDPGTLPQPSWDPANAARPAIPGAAPRVPAGARVFDISLPLTLDDTYLGDLRVTVDGDKVTIDAQQFMALLETQLTPSTIAEIKSRIVNGKLTPATASTSNVRITYNSAYQQIEVASLLSARGRRLINFGSTIDQNNRVNADPAGFAAFINATANLEYRWKAPFGQDTGRLPVTGNLDVGGRLGGNSGIAFISRQNYAESGGPGITRTESQLIYDNVDKLLRVTAGDLNYRGDSFSRSRRWRVSR